MASTMVKKVMLKIVADDGNSEAKLDKITAKAVELGKQHPDLKVKIDTAAASAKLAVLRKELKDTSNAAAGDGVSLKSRLMSLGSTAGVVAGLGDAFGVFSKDASMASRVMSGFSLATGLLEAPMAGLIVGVGGLAAGLATAGIGLAAFGAVAKSNYATAATAATKAQAADTAYKAAMAKANFLYERQMAAATTATQRQAAASAHAKAQLAAQAAQVKTTTAIYAQMSPAQQDLSNAILGVQNRWQSFVQSNTAGVSKVLTQGMGLIPPLFATMQQFMAPVESALSGIIGMLSKDMKSSGFITFMAGVAAYTGPSITKIGHIINNVVSGIGGILQAFMPMSQSVLGGIDKITAKFAHWGQTLTTHSGFQSLVSMAKADMPLVMQVLKNLGQAFVHLGASMTGLSTFSNSKMILQLLVPLSQLLNTLVSLNPALTRTGLYALAAGGAFTKMKPAVQGIRGAVKDGASALVDLRAGFSNSAAAASGATGIWGTFGGRMSKMVTAIKGWNIQSKLAAAATKIWTGIQAAFNIVMAMNPIGLVVIAIGLLVAAFVILIIKCKPFREFWIHLWHDVVHIVSVAVDWVRTHWKLLATIMLAIVAGPFGLVVGLVISHFSRIKSGATRLVGDVTGWFRRLPGMILSALGDLGKLLWQGGVNLVMGLVHGLESAAMAPVHAVGSIVSSIRNLLPFSPAKTGPLSGTGSPELAGRKIPLMLAAGIGANTPAVRAAATRMAGAAAYAASGGAGGGGGPLVLRIEGSEQGLIYALILALRKQIRIQGGDVQAVLGH